MYHLIPTEDDETRDEDRTVSGSVRDQDRFMCDGPSNQKKGFFRSIAQRFRALKPSFLRSSHPDSSCRTRTAAGDSGPTISGFHLPKKKDEYLIDTLFCKRLWKIAKILFSKHCGKQSKVFWLYLSMTLFCIVNEGIVYYVGTIPSRYYKVLGDKDSSAFWKLLLTSLTTVFLAGFGKSGIFLLGSLLSLESRRSLTLYFHQIYIRPKLFYRILFMRDEEVDNPDQRITQDIEKISESIRKMVEDLIIIPLLIAFYTWKCWQMTGYVGPLCIYGYFILSTIISRLLINPIVDAVFYKESAEGYFRFLHMRFRQFAESITFSRGEGEAKDRADELLEVLLKTQLDVIYKELPLKFLQQSVSYFGSILSYVIIAIPIFWGSYDHLPPSDISAVISRTSFVSMYLTYLFSKIIQCSTDFSDLAGYTSRLGQLMEALDELNTEIETIAIEFPHEEALSMDTSIRFRNVAFNTPTGDLVMSDFNFRFEAGLNTMIVGPNGSGKTSLLRAMGGLWPVSRGEILLPHRYRKEVIFLPQVSYMTYGSLREQLVYPFSETASSMSDADVIRVLKLARLENVVDLIDDFDYTYTLDWGRMLSPGEMQKMAFARLFYLRPMFAILDEATSSMDTDSEHEMFKQCRLLNITCITVCHNKELEKYHQQKISLENRGVWSFSQIQESENQDSPDDQDDNGSNTRLGSGSQVDLSLPQDDTPLQTTDY
ncbi:ABC transporter transmembrane region 2-domain-containing protein [Gamsiella multidivaricata]|uniref:ABC transporter transmembrane region 2-domain-containing protein n=1 Tax=Gamsiella multidivaricata TaxID=101098 RepID=UPI00221E86A9|nr:ABC transporter transmembrane region 2-domain-containing protein [Gamsiella multidivaricata]KAI7817319.1 ABC transporter transmembrane region 2-domain-containing protein [Gamsiella multidivaricata]